MPVLPNIQERNDIGSYMKIMVDADACPVNGIVEKVAKEYGISVVMVCDTNHIIKSDYSSVQLVSPGKDAADFALINKCQKGDVVVTQDYSVAAMALGKGAFCIHQSGRWYTDDNIDTLLMERHLAGKQRRSSSRNHMKGPAKRTSQNDTDFEASFRKLLDYIIARSGL